MIAKRVPSGEGVNSSNSSEPSRKRRAVCGAAEGAATASSRD
jgi:hypothetical protein